MPLERVVPHLLEIYGADQLPPVCAESSSSIPVVGTGSLGKTLASCCHPQPGDDIVGHIPPSDHTVEIHRSDCATFLRKLAEDRHRFVEVKWGRACETFLACMEIMAHDRPFFLRDVWEIISYHGLNVSDVDVKVNRAQDATISVCVDVENWLQFNRVLSRIEDLPGTIWVRRMSSPGEAIQGSEGEGGT